jgi:hypothetical protein
MFAAPCLTGSVTQQSAMGKPNHSTVQQAECNEVGNTHFLQEDRASTSQT